MSKKKTTKQFYSPFDWEEIQRDIDYDKRFKALKGQANIRPFGDITNTAYGKLCREYNEYCRRLKRKK